MTLLKNCDESVGWQELVKSLNSLGISVMPIERRVSSYMYFVPTTSCSVGLSVTEHPGKLTRMDAFLLSDLPPSRCKFITLYSLSCKITNISKAPSKTSIGVLFFEFCGSRKTWAYLPALLSWCGKIIRGPESEVTQKDMWSIFRH